MNNILTKLGLESKFGEDIPLSVYGVISKVNSLFISSVLGITIGSQPIIGFNYGAGNNERVKEALKKVLTINFTIGIIFNIIFVLFPISLESAEFNAFKYSFFKFYKTCMTKIIITKKIQTQTNR